MFIDNHEYVTRVGMDTNSARPSYVDHLALELHGI